jgi:Protein of unknown function (DUF2959)
VVQSRLPRLHGALVSLPLLLGACASGPDQQAAPGQVESLVTWVEKVHVEAEVARDKMAEALTRLQTLAASDFRKEPVVNVYAHLVQGIDASEQQGARLKNTVAPMKAASLPVFTQWEKDVTQITAEQLRQKSQMRLALAKERYQAIVAAADPALADLETFNRAMRDQALFLGHDLNPSSLGEIQNEVKALSKTAHELDRKLDMTLVAARAYVEFAALPTSALAAPPAPPGGRR